jgi:hypothetical protein
MKYLLLSLLFSGFTLTTLPLRAADEKTEEAAGESQLGQVKLGEAILNGPVTMDSLKGKAVVLEFWGIH